MEKFGSRINIPDPQHSHKLNKIRTSALKCSKSPEFTKCLSLQKHETSNQRETKGPFLMRLLKKLGTELISSAMFVDQLIEDERDCLEYNVHVYV
jgi:hypothetical protein